MSKTERQVYVNGEYVPVSEAKVSVFDRGYLFADAIYEVTCVIGGKLVDFHSHMARLARSMQHLSMPFKIDEAGILAAHRTLIALNGIDEGLIYLQVSRGVADRDFSFPPADTKPGIIMFTQTKAVIDNPAAKTGIAVITLPDIRWGRRDIKTVQLLYSSMAKDEAYRAGAQDAWLVQDGLVTEASSANAYIVTVDGKIITRSLTSDILHGITRASVVRFAEETGCALEERAFTVAEALAAREAFITSATAFVTPVIRIDNRPVGDGAVGPVSKRLRDIYIERAVNAAI
ncbi:D-amino-acid transaminase [Pararhizobium sp.]|uniref:D-amino-acid transaminase n=1 Tax=Pararhizobium sp. TaxID=1977563 RepID=UPI002721E924|nr:D-amino-acid transaminase [Pararhizobium sp.]MDO9418156.1 D-amino-acid transaminase [Pararhizobium sp.]